MAAERFHDEGTYLFELGGSVDVRCEFCGREYRFPEAELGALFQARPLQHEAPPHLH